MRRVLPILIVLFSIAAVACGNAQQAAEVENDQQAPANAEAKSEPSPSGNAAAAPAAPALAPPASTQAAPVETQAGESTSGGIFTRLWADPPTLDPHLTSDTTSAGVVVELYSGLVTINADLELVPDISDSWTISEDGRVYTFNIRPNAKFHDGKSITANDFKWSLERAANPGTGSPVSDTYLNDIIGVQDVFDGISTEISGVQVIDDQTLQITIDAPKAYFLAKLTYPTAYVLDQANIESGGRTWTDEPNGSGPFRLGEYKIGERIVLERNEHYYRELAKLDKVVMNLAGGQSMAMYENDEIDITGVGLFDLDRVLDPEEKINSDLIVSPPDFSISYIGFNVTEPPFDDPKFRQALNHAVDKRLIATEVLADLVVPAYGILPPGFPGYNPDLTGLEFDADLAKRLLAESAYPDAETRPRIVITMPGTGGSISLNMEVVIEMWRQNLGVEVEIQQVEWATFLQDLNASKFQAFGGLGWEADYPDPQDFLDILFHTESALNHGEYSNAEVDSILEEARIESDIAKRVELYRDAEKAIVDDAAWMPLWYGGERHVLVKPHIQGYRVTPMVISKLKDVYIQE